MARQVRSSNTKTQGIAPYLPSKIQRLGVKNYNEEEILIIREHFNPLDSRRSCEMIHERYLKHRTVAGILGKASKLGLQRPVRLRKWTKEETLILESNIEESLGYIYRTLQSHWQKNDMPFMGYPAVRRQALLMGKGTRCEKDGYVTKEYLAEGLGCSLHVITTWVKKYSTILHPQSPQSNVSTIFIPLTGFRRFIRSYPGEISKCRPDLLWLLTILFKD